MGGSSSKDTVPTTDNKGVLNGNIINNGQIIEKVEDDLQKENILLIIIIILKVISILIVGIKWFVKHPKTTKPKPTSGTNSIRSQ